MVCHQQRRGFTLIELLCVVAIIGILASLLLGPVSRALQKARAAEWADKVNQRIERVVNALRAHCSKGPVTDRLNPEQLFERGIIDSEQLRFLGDRRVRYVPFVTADPDDLVVIEVRIPRSFLNDEGVERVRKERLTATDKLGG